MKDNDKLGSFLIGVFIGGLIGSVAALLYAPTSGKQLRKKIKDKTGEIVEDAEELYNTGKDKAEELFNEGKKKAASIAQDVKKFVSN